MRAKFRVVDEFPTRVTIIDGANYYGSMSITNDAEAVTEYLIKEYGPEKKFFYWDTEGELTELLHDGKVFTGFGLEV